MNIYPIIFSFCAYLQVRTKNGLKQLENSVSRSHLKRLRLDVYNSLLIPILNGLKTNRSVTELAVSCKQTACHRARLVRLNCIYLVCIIIASLLTNPKISAFTNALLYIRDC